MSTYVNKLNLKTLNLNEHVSPNILKCSYFKKVQSLVAMQPVIPRYGLLGNLVGKIRFPLNNFVFHSTICNNGLLIF